MCTVGHPASALRRRLPPDPSRCRYALTLGPVPDDDRTRVLSIQSHSKGNQVYSETLRTHFAESARIDLDGVWLDASRTIPERLLYRAMDLRLPGRVIAAGNLDLRRARNEAAVGMLARGLVGRKVREGGAPDVLHVHTQVPALMSVGWMRRFPTVLTTDATALNHAEMEAQPAWTHRPSIALDRRVFRAAARAVFFSAWARDSAVEPYGLDPDRAVVIPPGVPTERFEVPDRRREGRLPVLLFVGDLVELKGGLDVVDVFRHELSGRAEVHLVTRGRLPEMPPGVTVHRGVRAYSPEWFALYAAADVFVLPTRIDRFGLVYLEAMAAGLPVVGSRINAVPELVTEGETGLLVPPADRPALAGALRALVDDPALRHRLGTAARADAVARFDMTTNLDRLGACFQDVAAEGVPAPL